MNSFTDFFSRILPAFLEQIFKRTLLNDWFRKQGSNAVIKNEKLRKAIEAKTMKVLKECL